MSGWENSKSHPLFIKCEKWSQTWKWLLPTGVYPSHITPTTFTSCWKGISWFTRMKGCAEHQLSKITSRSRTTSMDMTSFLSRIFHHDSRTWNCHWDGLYQERTPSESTRRHMDVSYLTLLTPLLVLCWVLCSDRIVVLRVINDSNIICRTSADGCSKLEESWQGNHRLLRRGCTYPQGKAHRTDQSWRYMLPLYDRFYQPGNKEGREAKKRWQRN